MNDAQKLAYAIMMLRDMMKNCSLSGKVRKRLHEIIDEVSA